MTALTWSTEKPTAPGWYWFRQMRLHQGPFGGPGTWMSDGCDPRVVEVALVENNDPVARNVVLRPALIARHTSFVSTFSPCDTTNRDEWSGPLVPPGSAS